MISLKLVDYVTHSLRYYYIPTVLHALNVVQSLGAWSISDNLDDVYTRSYTYVSVAKVVYVAYTSSCESAAVEAAYNIAFVYFATGINADYDLPIYLGFVLWSVAMTYMNVAGFYLEIRSPDFNKRSEEAYKNLNISTWFSNTHSTSRENVGPTFTKIEIEHPDTMFVKVLPKMFRQDDQRSKEAYKNLNIYSSWFSNIHSTSCKNVGPTFTKIEIEHPDTMFVKVLPKMFSQDDKFVRYSECQLAGEAISEQGCVAA